jgi:hypothetical protein
VTEPRSGLDVVLIAVAVLQTSLEAGSWREALDFARADLEVLDRDTLVRVAASMAVEATWVIPPRTVRRGLRARAQHRRLALMVGRT